MALTVTQVQQLYTAYLAARSTKKALTTGLMKSAISTLLTYVSTWQMTISQNS